MKQFGHTACNDCAIRAGVAELDCYAIDLFGEYRCDLCRRKLDTENVPVHFPTRRAMRDLQRRLAARKEKRA